MRKIKSILLVAFLSLITNQAFTQTENWQQEVDKYNSILEQERHIGIADTGRYLDALYELSFLYYEVEKYNDVINISIEADALSRHYYSSVMGKHVALLARLANSYEQINNYPNAIDVQIKMLDMEEDIYSNGKITKDGLYIGLPDIVKDYLVLSSFTIMVRDAVKTKESLLHACELMEKNDIVDSIEMAGFIYENIVNLYYFIYDSVDLAVQYQTKKCLVYQRKGNLDAYRKSMNELAKLYFQRGNKYAENKDFHPALNEYLFCDSILNVIG